LKVTVGLGLVWNLKDEINGYGRIQHPHLAKLGASRIHIRDLYGGLVSFPVGSKPNFESKRTISAAKETLLGPGGLLSSSIIHGDARLPNLLYDEANKIYFWVDLHTVRKGNDGHGEVEESDIARFERDLDERYGTISEEDGD
jgi:hypothetical protein